VIPFFYVTPFSAHERLKLVIRPDKEESDAVLSKIIERKREGWVLLVTDHYAWWHSSKPKDPNWNDDAPKGLLIVLEGEHYRRIGLCSFESRLDHVSRVEDIRKLLRSCGEVKEITII
jgi:hypothetical protein